ncbi:efflux transporter outer membrane subunit [Novacetimonas cocois]|uniref:Efflux transporter outer membrane subunit n=1 Tax=Novacetimonas cocois TaxID=1747507 RepID=A0A365YR13_9PROT|nr:efflux transporter outer membrane subunit [Novacetimonas cocois]RBM05201.1 hypothetical protein NJLHNGOC_14015 [Novacetimonas cocois]
MYTTNRVQTRAWLLFCSTLLALSGCAPGRDERPEGKITDVSILKSGHDIEQAQQQSAHTSPAKAWWLVYHDPQLERLVGDAQESAPSIQIAQARLREAAAVEGAARANQLPHVDGFGWIAGEQFPNHSYYPAPYKGNFGSEGKLQLDVQYHVDFWGRWRKLTRSARYWQKVSSLEVADARLLIQTAMVSAYVRLDAAYRMRDVAQQGLSRREGIVEMLALREKAGLSTDINAVAAREALTDTRSQIDLLDGEISARRHEIAALLGKSPDFGDAIARPHLPVIADPAPLSNVPAVLLGYRPDVEAKRAAVEATSNAVGAARAAFYPDVDLVAFAGFRSLDIGHMMRPGSVATQFGPAVTLPIFEGGQLRAALKNRLGEYDAAVNDYNATVSKALQQAADGISDLKARQATRQEAEAAVRHWQHVVDLERIRQKNGLSDTNDRLAAETALLLSERRSVEAAARVAEAQITLIRALGGAWSPSFTFSAGQKYHG